MANYSEQITALHRSLDGVIAVMLLDAETGFTLAQVGGDEQSEVVGAGITQFTSLFNATMEKLNYPHLEENTFTIGDQLQVMYRLAKSPSVYLLSIVDRRRSNLGAFRVQTKQAAAAIEV